MLAKNLLETFTVGGVQLQRFNIFDEENPKGNNRLFRWANSFHSLTRESVIRSQLLFSSGEIIEFRTLEESEPLLRNLKFRYDAKVRPYRICGDVVDIRHLTRDVWTFRPSISFSRYGGSNNIDFALRYTSFLELESSWNSNVKVMMPAVVIQ